MSYPIHECQGGEIIEYRPQPDDPEFAVTVGPCPLWPGCGCEWDLPEQRDGEPDHAKKEPSDAKVERFFYRNNYLLVRKLPDGRWLGVQRQLFTWGLFVMDAFTWHTRYCYEHRTEAEVALQAWDGTGDPPGMWIKQKPEDRYGPGSSKPL